jgi:hypothetical protein
MRRKRVEYRVAKEEFEMRSGHGNGSGACARTNHINYAISPVTRGDARQFLPLLLGMIQTKLPINPAIIDISLFASLFDMTSRSHQYIPLMIVGQRSIVM